MLTCASDLVCVSECVWVWVCKRLECRIRLTCVRDEHHGLKGKDFGPTNFLF